MGFLLFAGEGGGVTDVVDGCSCRGDGVGGGGGTGERLNCEVFVVRGEGGGRGLKGGGEGGEGGIC